MSIVVQQLNFTRILYENVGNVFFKVECSGENLTGWQIF
jgi:hypothetical protein